MKKSVRIITILGGLSCIIFLLIAMSTALLTDKEVGELDIYVKPSTVDISLKLNGPTGTVSFNPGTALSINPVITNMKSTPVYAFIEMDLPVINEKPLLSFEINDS